MELGSEDRVKNISEMSANVRKLSAVPMGIAHFLKKYMREGLRRAVKTPPEWRLEGLGSKIKRKKQRKN